MMMQRNILLVLAAFTLLLASSCLQDNTESVVPGKSSFSLTYTVQGSSINRYASVPAEEGESRINSLWMLFFKNSSGGTGEFIEAHKVAATYPLSLNATINVKFEVSSKLTYSTDYNLLIVANLEDNISDNIEDWLALQEGKQENDVIAGSRALLTTGVSEETDYSSSVFNRTSLLMSAKAQKLANQDNVSVELVRTVARFDVANADEDYRLASASLWNAFPHTSIWESSFNNFASQARIPRLYGVEKTAENEIKGALYGFENFVTRPELTDQETTCLIIGLERDGATRYYRVNVNARNIGQQLKRNNVYKVTIKSVLGEGAPSETDAYRSGKLLLETKINEWNEDDQGIIQYDGENILAIPTTNITFTQSAETREFNIFTLGRGTLEMSKSLLPLGITATLSESNVLTVSAEASEVNKEGYVELRFGNLKAVINITQNGEKQTFLKLSGVTIPMFPSAAGSTVGADGTITVTSSDPWIAEIYNGSFSFSSSTTVSKIEGNDNETFTIYTTNTNTNPKPHYAFVLVSLKDDPEVNRTIVLTQKGTQGITIDGNVAELNFTADGTPVGTNVLTIETGDDEWQASVSAAESAHFTLTKQDDHTLIVTANQNPEISNKSVTLTISLTDLPAIKKTVTLRQEHHTISISPTTVGVVAIEGATLPITVSTTGSWKASVSSGNIPGVTLSKAFGTDGEQFNVTLPALASILSNAEVTVTIAVTDHTGTLETNVKTTITIRQAKMEPRSIVSHSMANFYGILYPLDQSLTYPSYTTKWLGSLGDGSKFGPSGNLVKIPTPGLQHSWKESYDYLTGWERKQKILQSLNNKDIFVYTSMAIDTVVSNCILEWLGAKSQRVLIVNSAMNAECAPLLIPGSATYKKDGIGKTHTVNHSTLSVSNNALYRYLFRDGPATKGEDISGLISLVGGNSLEHVLTKSSEDTNNEYGMIPLLMYPGSTPAENHMVLGIDPKKRIVYCGNILLFSYYKFHESTNSGANWNNEANNQFVDNLNAWIINAAMYGDAFTKDYWIENQTP